MLSVFFGHHRCATTWLANIFQDLAALNQMKWVYVHNPPSFKEWIAKDQPTDLLFHANARIECVKALPEFRGFHIIRDPRDIVVSTYFSHLYSHPEQPWLIPVRKKLRSLPKDEGLLYQMEEMKGWLFDNLINWDYHQDQVLELKFEDVIRQPEFFVCKALTFIGLITDPGVEMPCSEISAYAISRSTVINLIRKHDYRVKSSGREPGQEDIHNHYRKGVAGDWKNHFTDDHCAWFKRNYADLLIKLGYEEDDNWQVGFRYGAPKAKRQTNPTDVADSGSKL